MFGQVISAKSDNTSDSVYAFKAIRINEDHIPVIQNKVQIHHFPILFYSKSC